MTFREVASRKAEVSVQREEEITHIISKEEEKVELVNYIHPYLYDGKVEEWLYDLEQSMKNSIKKIIADGLRDYPVSRVEDAADHLSQSTSYLYNARIRWLNSWPS